MTPRVAGAAIGAILAAAGAAAGLVVTHEGWLNKTYLDPVGIPTACAGITEGVVKGRTYSDDECIALTVQAVAKHGSEIARCLPAHLPTDARAAFTSFSYNVGTGAFCKSTLARKANAGDLRGACAELSRWTYAGGRQLPGLVTRRAAERAMCERGLT